MYADEYIDSQLDGDKDKASDCFVDMIYYIADRIPRPGTDDIDLLDGIFSVYVRLCAKCGVLPTLECFSFLVSINRDTFWDWSTRRYRASSSHGDTVKKWRDICKSSVVNRLHNKGGTDANLIFIAKAAYGMAETAPVQTAEPPRRVMAMDELPVLDAGTDKELSDNSSATGLLGGRE